LVIIKQIVSGQLPQELPASVVKADVQVQDQAQQPVFDRQALLVRLGGNEALIQKFVTMFFDSANEHMNLLRQSFEAGDAEQMWAKAHAIKGSAGNVGACALSAAAAELEKAVRELQLAEQPALLARLEEQYRLFERETGRKGG
jgi:HPt (histidine-containing phosphotransfer) domain-containing protein